MQIRQNPVHRPVVTTTPAIPAKTAQAPALPTSSPKAAQAPIASASSSLPALQGQGGQIPGSTSPTGARMLALAGGTQRAEGFGSPRDVRPVVTNKAGGPREDLIPDPAVWAKDLNADGTTSTQKTTFKGPLFVDGANFEDVQQGQLANCYFCAATAAVAYKNPQLIENAVKANGDGTYDVTFYGYNQYSQLQATQIRVDGDLHTKWGSPAYGRSAGSKSPDSMEMWFPLVEKAYAQWCGSYDKIGNGGWPRDVMQALTGAPGQTFQTAIYSEDQIYQWATQLETTRTVSAAFTYGEDQAALYTNTGVHASHAYTVLGAAEENGQRFIRLRNPWGHGEPGSDGKDDGIFKLPVADFIKLFPNVDVGTA